MFCDLSPIATVIESGIVFLSERNDTCAARILEDVLHELLLVRDRDLNISRPYQTYEVFEQEVRAAALFLQLNSRIDAATRLLLALNRERLDGATG